MKYSLLFLFFCIISTYLSNINAKDTITIKSPLKIPLLLSGNYGELRNNHFHTGLDFKTQGRTGLPIYAVDKGYVSRISVSPYGYGLALYIDHPSGITTVYGHLDHFAPYIDKIVKQKQYEEESFSVNFYLKKDELKVEQGQIVAYSGNTGSSGGPHLHFEMRHTESENLINPAPYFKNKLVDTRCPSVRSIAIYPVKGKGVVNGSSQRKIATPTIEASGKYTINNTFTAWGDIYFGIKAYDHMNNTSNIYGIYSLKIYVDNSPIYSFEINDLSFDVNRAVNSLIDYADWKNNKSFYMRSYVAPGNQLPIYTNVIDRGIFKIQQEKDYRIRYELSDIYGNTSVVNMIIKGRKQAIPDTAFPQNTYHLPYNKKNIIKGKGIYWELPQGALYEDIDLKYKYNNEYPEYFSPVYTLGEENIPLHTYTTLKIQITNDTIQDKKQYYVARLGKKGESALCGNYENGYITVSVRDLGRFTVKVDSIPPTIIPLTPEKWGRSGRIRLRIGDTQSGIKSFRGEIDGKFVIFSMDGKTSIVQHTLETSRTVRGKKHSLHFEVIDFCGNIKQYKKEFYW